jgi:hypothetical protein
MKDVDLWARPCAMSARFPYRLQLDPPEQGTRHRALSVLLQPHHLPVAVRLVVVDTQNMATSHPVGNRGSREVEEDSKGTDTVVAQSAEGRYHSLQVVSMYKNTAVGAGRGKLAVLAETVAKR